MSWSFVAREGSDSNMDRTGGDQHNTRHYKLHNIIDRFITQLLKLAYNLIKKEEQIQIGLIGKEKAQINS